VKNRRRIILGAFAIIAICLTTFIFRAFVYRNLIDPIARVAWLVIRSLLSIDQEVFWLCIIILALILSLMIIPIDKQPNTRSAYSYSNKVEDRASFWKMQFLLADKNIDSRGALQKNMDDLSDALDELIDLDKSDENIKNSSRIDPIESGIFNHAMWINLMARFRPKTDKFVDKRLERNLKQILDSMESKMESQNDRISNDHENS